MKTGLPFKLMLVDRGDYIVVAPTQDDQPTDMRAAFKAFHRRPASMGAKLFVVPASFDAAAFSWKRRGGFSPVEVDA